jgi:CubicO group peptidase (beta-lactamase class C family)
MNHKQILPIIFVLFFCALLLGCQSKVTEVQEDSLDLALPPIPKQPAGTVMEIGTIASQVDNQLQVLFDESGVPSFTVGIVVADELIWAKSYGGHAGTDTVYEIGSVAKPFIATAILQLYEAGQIDLDADAGDYLPFPLRHPNYPDTVITVRMLLTNQSGLAADTEDLRRFLNPSDTGYHYIKASMGLDLPELNLHPQPTRAEFFEAHLLPGGAYYTKDVWAQEPGIYLYSNVGYSTLAYLIECVTGAPVEDYLHENIFSPLEMDLSGSDLGKLAPYAALPYQRIQGDYIFIPFLGITASRLCSPSQVSCYVKNLTNAGGYFPVPDGLEEYLEKGYLCFPLLESLIGSGGLRTTVPDLAEFMVAHMNDGQAPNGFQLLQPETVEMMHEIAVPHDGSINMIPMTGYGMGWTLAEGGIQGHIGGAFGSEAEMLYTESSQGNYGIIFLRNWSWELADDYDNGFEYWKKYHVGVREILMDAAEMISRSPMN